MQGTRGIVLAEAVMGTIRQPLLVFETAHLRVEAANHAFCRGISTSTGRRSPVATSMNSGTGSGRSRSCKELARRCLCANNGTVQDYRVEHEFEHIGRRVMVLRRKPIAVGRTVGCDPHRDRRTIH